MSTDRAAIKAILWKESRENLKWAILGLLFVSMGMLYFLGTLLGESSHGGGLNWALVSRSLFSETPYLTPVVGLMIGIAQVILENRGDSWGFLTHRPMQRSTLFWGKATAGMMLYFAAVGVPLLCGSVWAAIPGHLPMPVDARMVLPLIADILCGLVYYFAGLLTGMREARWYASRVMGIGIGIACSFAVSVVPEFWQAAACCALGILISSASAWGTFVEGGRLSSQPRLTRFATALCIGAGLVTTGIIVFNVGASFLRTTVPDSVVTYYRITGDGAIVLTDYVDDSIAEVRDLQGRPIEKYRDPEVRRAPNRGVVASQIYTGIHYPWNGDYRKTKEFFQAFQSRDQLSDGETVTWYYIPRLGRIAAYHNRSGKLIGWMGPRGFTSGTEMPQDRFERPLAGNILPAPTLIAFEDAVYRLDTWRRQLEKIFTAEIGESIIGASDFTVGPDPSESGGGARSVAILTTKRVVIQSRDGATPLSVPREAASKKFGGVIVTRSLLSPVPQTFIWYTNDFGSSGFVMQYGATGTPVNQYTLPRLAPNGTLTWDDVLIRSIMQNLAIRIVVWKNSIFNDSDVRHSPGQWIAWWLIPIFEAVLFAGLAFARGRRYAFSNRRIWLWTAAGFVLGPLGFALMLSLLEWPAFENCQECGRSRLVTREKCEHCSKPFKLPHADGTEVFEPIALS